MKKLIISIFVSLFATLSFSSTALAITSEVPASNRFWQVQIFTPALTDSNKSLNVEYTVLSTLATDSNFTVTLYQNGSSVGAQTINHPNGNSGAFNIGLPATGSYSYKIDVANTSAGETKTSETKTIQIVDGPAPIITTVQRNLATTANATNANAPVTTANSVPSGASRLKADSEKAKKDSAKSTGGQVTDKAATTADGKSLGSKTDANKDKSKLTEWVIAGVVALAIGGAGYYWFVIRPRLED